MHNWPNQSHQSNQSSQPTPFNPPQVASPTGNTQPPSPPTAPRPYRHGGKVLAVITVLYGLGWWFAFAGAVGNAVIYALATLAIGIICYGLFAVDWRGYTSLAGLIKWRQMSSGGRMGVGCLFFIFLPLMPAIYLMRAIMQYYRTTGQTVTGQINRFFRTLPQRTQRARLLLLTGSIVAVLSFCTLSGVAVGGGHGTLDTSSLASGDTTNTPSTSNVNVAHITTTATPRPQPTATHQSTATPIPQPTATPKPSCMPGAVNCNPWGYNFSHGSVIYNPPYNICDYFNCIPSFWDHTNGYVEECQDGTYSHSGGVRGSCSYHGGNWRALLKP